MLFGKYHVVIFRERNGGSRSLRLRGGLGVFFFLFIGLLIAGNFWLGDRFLKSRALESRLVEAERLLEERYDQLRLMISDLAVVRDDLRRIQAFDAKLRIIMDMEVGVSELGMGGTPDTESLTLGYLPLHRQDLASRKIRAFLRELAAEVRLEEVQQQELLLSMRANRDNLAVIPSIWPVDGTVTSDFGPRFSPFTGQVQQHSGLDISARVGTPIYAPARGTVISAGNDGAYGISLDINHGGGIVTKYAHMQKFVVNPGQTVERGDLIGYVGRTGRVTGPHLHYEVRLSGVATNPYSYILN
jgi:murein DD-endopeptidase MepM/ murein hydrolase activator NlpD